MSGQCFIEIRSHLFFILLIKLHKKPKSQGVIFNKPQLPQTNSCMVETHVEEINQYKMLRILHKQYYIKL